MSDHVQVTGLPTTINFWSDASGFGVDWTDADTGEYHVMTVMRAQLRVVHLASKYGQPDRFSVVEHVHDFGEPAGSFDGWKQWVAEYHIAGCPEPVKS